VGELIVRYRFPPWIYGLLCIPGALVPWYFNVRQMIEGGTFSVPDFFAAGFTSHYAGSLTSDFLIGSTAVIVWMVVEARRLGMRWWAYLLATFLVAFAFACPLFLMMRERRLRARAA
jgi:Na+/H+ antiporter NhaD/arsenite permease-like protein